MKIKELFFSSHGIRATFLTTFLTLFLLRTFSGGLSPLNLLLRSFSVVPSPVDHLRRNFSRGPFPTDLLRRTFSCKPSLVDLLCRTLFPADFFGSLLFPAIYLDALFWSHQLVVQSIPTTNLMVMSHFGYINLPYSQFRQLFQ